MIGQERTVLPLLADEVFGLTAFTAALTFIVAFGIVKAATNFFAGTLSDRYGRKPVLVAGWIIGLPVPLLLMWAPTWGWVVFANVLLGVNQGLTWSTTVIMKIDLVGPAERGLAMGFNEAAGYGAVAVTALATGYIAEQLRAAPRTVLPRPRLRRARPRPLHPRSCARPAATPATRRPTTPPSAVTNVGLTTSEVFTLTSFRDKALSSCSQAGLVNNLNDGLAWGLFPIYFADAGPLRASASASSPRSTRPCGGSASSSPAALSDRSGRKPLIVGGMLVQAAAIAWIAATTGFADLGAVGALCSAPARPWSTPPCSPAIGDVAHPPGGPARSASTGCGATPASPSARSSPASSPTRSA